MKIRTGRLEQTVIGGKPLCMEQYSRMFGCARIPSKDRDHLQISQDTDHIIVLANGQVFPLQVVFPDGKILSQKSLEDSFKKILEVAHQSPKGLYGLFTTMERNEWAEARSNVVGETSLYF